MGHIQAAWIVVMDDEHNDIYQADLGQFAAETLSEIGKRRWPTTKKPRVCETALVVPIPLGMAIAGLGHFEPFSPPRLNGRCPSS